jgi:hypothetical protein
MLFYLTIKNFKRQREKLTLTVIKQMKLVFMINQLKIKMKRKSRKLGPTLLFRIKQTMRHALYFNENFTDH